MMEKKGIVKDIAGGSVLVSTFFDEGCKSCNMCGGCSDLELDINLFAWDVKKGDEVIIDTRSDYAKVVFLIYLFPIFMLIAGYFAGKMTGTEAEWVPLTTAGGFFLVSFPLIRVLGKKTADKAVVTVTKYEGE